MDEYQYSSLSYPTAIRVLVMQILKTVEDPTHPVSVFKLEEVNLQESPIYEALSYTWGETTYYDGFTYLWDSGPPRTYPIAIHGSGLFQVTRNLNEFLQYLTKNAPVGATTRRIWADQICINQKNIEERNSQVTMMKDIYTSAQRTLIWLGEEDADTLSVLDMLHAVDIPSVDGNQELTGTLLQELQQRVRMVLHAALDGKFYDGYIKSLINTLNKPWFSRAWIVQEATFSVFTIVLLGTEEIEFSLLHRLMVVVATVETEVMSSRSVKNSQVLRSRGAQTVRHVEKLRRQTTSSQENFSSFPEILQQLAFSFDATDARDQVHAFLAFQDPREEKILPDYSLDTSAAYTVVSASIARSSKSLSIFGLIRGSKYFGLLPSWVVDWRLNKSTQGTPFDKDSKDVFDACKGYQYKPAKEHPQLSRVLTVKGKIIGRIAIVSTVAHESQQDVSKAWKLEQVVKSLKLSAHSRSKGKNLSILNDPNLRRRVVSVLMAQDMRGFMADIHQENPLDQVLRAYDIYDRAVREDTSVEDASESGRLIQKLNRRTFLCVKKRVFCTNEGLIGLGPQLISDNDFVCILHGSKVPCIMRKQGNDWKVIGLCFYEEGMHGEFVDWKEADGDTFDLL